MMIPSMVRKERILFPQILFKAILNDCSIFFHIPIKLILPSMIRTTAFCLQGNGAVVVIITMVFPSRLSFFKNPEPPGQFGIQGAAGLVSQDQRRISRQGPGNGDPLLLAA